MTPEPKASFIQGTLSRQWAIQTIYQSKIATRIAADLEHLDKGVAYLEQLTQLGTTITLNRTGKLHLSKDDFKKHLGAAPFGEMVAIATRGRAFLKSLGYESKVTVAPAVLMKTNDDTAAAMVTPFQTENPGEPPLQGMKVSTFGFGEEQPPANPPTDNP